MNINLHIERLILDGLNIGPDQGSFVKAAVETELSRLLSEGGLASGLQSGGALPNIRAGSLELNGNENPSRLGQEIARSIYSGIGESK
jgi:hypothetical protein